MFDNIQVGDTVTRMLGGVIPIPLRVTAISDTRIFCGPEGIGWQFDKQRGFEVDDDLGWGQMPNGNIRSGSYIKPYNL